MTKKLENKLLLDKDDMELDLTDTELLNAIENMHGYSLVSDDNGHWALVCDGIQNVPMSDDPEDIQTTFWIEAHCFKPSVREAILYGIGYYGGD